MKDASTTHWSKPRRLSAALGGLATAASLAASCAQEGTQERSDRTQPQRSLYQGQSGSEYDGPPPGGEVSFCPCGGVSNGAVLRVTLLGRTSAPSITGELPWCEPNPVLTMPFGETVAPRCERLTLRVEELLHGETKLQVGAEIEADSDGYLPCPRGLSEVTTGALALATVRFAPPEYPACAARQACVDECARAGQLQLSGQNPIGGAPPCPPDAGSPSEACRLTELWCRLTCEGGFDDVCPPRPEPSAQELRERWVVQLTPWDEQIVFARVGEATISVPPDDLSRLWGDTDQCVVRYGNWAELPGAFPDGLPSGG